MTTPLVNLSFYSVSAINDYLLVNHKRTKNYDDVIIQHVDFSKQNFQGYSFKNADLSYADCEGTDFSEAYLENTHFFGADLKNIKFTKNILDAKFDANTLVIGKNIQEQNTLLISFKNRYTELHHHKFFIFSKFNNFLENIPEGPPAKQWLFILLYIKNNPTSLVDKVFEEIQQTQTNYEPRLQ